MEHGADPGGSASGTNEQRTEEPAEIDANGILALDGMQASQAELSRARVTAQFLEALLPSLVDDGDAAQALHDVAALRSYPLDDPGAALEAIRAAFARRPALHIARAYRKAAIRAGSLDDQLAALEGEIKLAPTPAYRATLETERGGLYERAVGNLAAARQSYAAAVEINPSDVTALLALLRLALRDGDRAAAAAGCKKIADAVGDPRVKAEFLAWAGRLYDAAGGQAEAALAAAVQGEVHAPDSPSVRFLLERLYAGEDNARELGASSSAGCATAAWRRPTAGSISATSIAIGSAMPSAPRRRSPRSSSAGGGEGGRRSRELSELAAARGDWARVVGARARAARRRARRDGARGDAGAHRTGARGAARRRRRRGDGLHAGRRGRRQLPAGAGRRGARVPKRGTVDKLVWMHRAEAAAATSPGERAGALVRAGELLVADAATVDEGIAALEEARAALPTARAMFDALELALRAQGRLRGAGDAVSHRGRSRRRGAARGVAAHADRRARRRCGSTTTSAPSRRSASPPASRATGRASRCRAWRSCSRTPTSRRSWRRCWRGWARSPTTPAEQASLLERAARLQERRGDVEASLGSYRRALELAPAGHTVYAAAGRAFRSRRALDGSIGAVRARDAAGRRAERAHYAYRAGLLLARKLGRLDDGIERLHETIALDPSIARRAWRWRRCTPRRGVGSSSGRCSPSCRRRRRCWRDARRSPKPAGGTKRRSGYGRRRRPRGWRRRRRRRRACLARLGRWNELAELYERGSEPAAHGSNGSNGSANGTAGKQALSRAIAPPSCASSASGKRRAPSSCWRRPSPASPTRCRCTWRTSASSTTTARPARDALKALVARTRDPALRVALLSQLASMLPEAEVVATRLNQMALSPRDPIITVHIEQTLEARRNREGLAALLRDLRRDPKSDPLLLASMEVQLGGLYEELGSLREAVDAFEAALGPRRSRRCWRGWRCRGSTARSATRRARPRR